MADPLSSLRALEQELREGAVGCSALETRWLLLLLADKLAACLAALPTQEWQSELVALADDFRRSGACELNKDHGAIYMQCGSRLLEAIFRKALPARPADAPPTQGSTYDGI